VQLIGFWPIPATVKTIRPQPLRIVAQTTVTAVEPLETLGEPGARLWRKIVGEYDFSDSAGQAMLTAACLSLDRADSLRAKIAAEGEVVTTPFGPRLHPAVGAEQQARNSCARILKQLGLVDQPKRDRPGRPPKSGGW
jgi:hypothetical protein